MATIIKVAGADFSANPIGFIPPVAAGLLYWNFFGGDAAKAVRNLAPGGAASTLVNAPASAASYISLGGASLAAAGAVQTPYPETAAQTILVVSRALGDMATSAPRPLLAGNYNFSASPRGTGLYANSASNIALEAGYLNPADGTVVQGLSTIAFTTPANWRFLATITNPTVERRLIDKTNAISATSAMTNQRALGNTNFRIGAAVSGLYGANDCAFAALYNRVLTDAEIDSAYQFVKAYLAKRSIAV